MEKLLEMKIFTGISIVLFLWSFFLSPAACSMTEPSYIPVEGFMQCIANTLKYSTESVDLLLNFLDYLNLETNDSLEYEFHLRNAILENKSLYRYMSNLYDRITALADWEKLYLAPAAGKELRHLENYAATLKEAVAKTVGHPFNLTDENIEKSCQLMPIGPPRRNYVVDSVAHRTLMQPSTVVNEYNPIDLIMSNIEEVMDAKLRVFELISFMLVDMPTEPLELHDLNAITKQVQDMNDSFWNHGTSLIFLARDAPNLLVDDSTVEKSQTLTRLAESIKDTMVGLDLYLYGLN